MAISKKEVDHIAKLARFSLSEKEGRKMEKDISAILDYFKLLEEKDTGAVNPTFHPTERFMKNQAEIARKDLAKNCGEEVVSLIISSFPEKKERYLRVKPILK